MIDKGQRPYPPLPEGLAERMRTSAEVIQRPRNDILYAEGDRANEMYVVRRGVVFSRRTSDTRNIINHVFHPGQIVGVESIEEEKKYTSTAIAANDIEIVSFSSGEINGLISLYPLYFMHVMTYHIRELERMQDLLKQPVSKRIIVAIDEFRNGNNRVCVDQSVLADRVGSDRPTVNSALANAGVVWEEVADLSLLRVNAAMREKAEELIKKFHRKTIKENDFMNQIMAESGLDMNTVRLVMDTMGIDESDFDRPRRERTLLRVLRTIDKCKDISGRVNVTQDYIADIVGVSVRIVKTSIKDAGLDWNTLVGKGHKDANTKVLETLEKYKDENGKVRVSKKLLAQAAGISERKFTYALEDLQIDWSKISTRKAYKQMTPETVGKVEKGIAAMKAENGRIPLTRTQFAKIVGVSPNTVTYVLSSLGLRWRDIADPAVYKDTQN